MATRYEATSLEGFIQQLAVGLVSRGYWFYVTGWVPEPKDPRAVDEKFTKLYDLGLTKSSRMRRKLAGRANVQYLRLGRFFVIVATLWQWSSNPGPPGQANRAHLGHFNIAND